MKQSSFHENHLLNKSGQQKKPYLHSKNGGSFKEEVKAR